MIVIAVETGEEIPEYFKIVQYLRTDTSYPKTLHYFLVEEKKVKIKK